MSSVAIWFWHYIFDGLIYTSKYELWPHKSNDSTVLVLDSQGLDKLYPVW